MFKRLALKFVQAKLTRVAAGGIGAVLAAVGGLTSISALQGAVEKASDYGARAVAIYCELPPVDRDRFRAEVNERLLLDAPGAAVQVTCPADEA